MCVTDFMECNKGYLQNVKEYLEARNMRHDYIRAT